MMMSTPYESAQLLLKLYELRREPLMREAREWFLREFHPRSMDDINAALASKHNPWFRMVIGYWDMACSFVTYGAIDEAMFVDASREMIPIFAKVHPFLADLRARPTTPGLMSHFEGVMMRIPGIEERLAALRDGLRAAHEARLAAAAAEGKE